MYHIPSGKRLHNYGKIHHFLWENPLLIAIFNSYIKLPEGISTTYQWLAIVLPHCWGWLILHGVDSGDRLRLVSQRVDFRGSIRSPCLVMVKKEKNNLFQGNTEYPWLMDQFQGKSVEKNRVFNIFWLLNIQYMGFLNLGQCSLEPWGPEEEVAQDHLRWSRKYQYIHIQVQAPLLYLVSLQWPKWVYSKWWKS